MMRAWGVLAIALLSTNLWAYDPSKVEVTGHELPKELENVAVVENLGSSLDLNLPFTDESGARVPLSTFFGGEKPVLMAMIYYNCPGLCNYHMNGLTDTMKQLKWTAGRDFTLLVVSMNHEETPDLAVKKKANDLKEYGRGEELPGWHFLVGDQATVKTLADQLGFRFQWIPEKGQFAHAAVAYALTPDGRISRYLHGIQPDATTLRLSLLEASDGKIGGLVEQVLMYCFQFDPKKNKYTIYAWNLMRAGAIAMVLLLAVLLVPVWWREFHGRKRA